MKLCNALASPACMNLAGAFLPWGLVFQLIKQSPRLPASQWSVHRSWLMLVSRRETRYRVCKGELWSLPCSFPASPSFWMDWAAFLQWEEVVFPVQVTF